MLSTQSGTNHQPGPYTVTLNILSHVCRGRRLRYPEPSVRLLRQRLLQRGTTAVPSRLGVSANRLHVPPPGLGGNIILVSESGADGADTSLVTWDGTNYVQTSFGPRPGVDEGSSLVDCGVPTATPTTTPTATFTPTATSTPTATTLRLQLQQHLRLQLRQRLRLPLQLRLRLQLHLHPRLRHRLRLLLRLRLRLRLHSHHAVLSVHARLRIRLLAAIREPALPLTRVEVLAASRVTTTS